MAQVHSLFKDEEGRPRTFCETPTALKILQVLEFTKELGYMGSIIGPPGVGKTTALKHYAKRTDDVYYAVMSPARSSLSATLSTVCQAVGVMAHYRRAADYHEVICGWAAYQDLPLLIIDEAQHLNDVSLEQLRCIRDETELAIVFCGNESLRIRFNNTKAAAFAQFTSRIAQRIELEPPGPEDATAIARANEIHDPKAVKFLQESIVGRAGLRRIAGLIDIARDASETGEIGLSDLKDASLLLGGG